MEPADVIELFEEYIKFHTPNFHNFTFCNGVPCSQCALQIRCGRLTVDVPRLPEDYYKKLQKERPEWFI